MGDVRDNQLKRLDAATRWVTITVGGNDVAYSGTRPIWATGTTGQT